MNTSEFVKFIWAAIKFQIFQLQAQLKLLDGLASLSRKEKLKLIFELCDEKLRLIFELCDEDGDGKIDARELASAFWSVNTNVTLQESLQSTIERMAICNKNKDNKLDEDHVCKGNNLEEEVAGYIAQDVLHSL